MFFEKSARSLEFARLFSSDLPLLLEHSPPELDANKCQLLFSLDSLPHNHLALAVKMAGWLGAYVDCLLWVTESGVWPSSQDLNLFYRYGQALGEHRELSEVPGVRFLGHETADLATHLNLIMYFGWGALVLPNPNWTALQITHDGDVRVISNSGLDQIRADLAWLQS